MSITFLHSHRRIATEQWRTIKREETLHAGLFTPLSIGRDAATVICSWGDRTKDVLTSFWRKSHCKPRYVSICVYIFFKEGKFGCQTKDDILDKRISYHILSDMIYPSLKHTKGTWILFTRDDTVYRQAQLCLTMLTVHLIAFEIW